MSDSREEESVSVRGRVLPLRQWEAEALVHAAVCAALFRGYWLVSLGFNLGAVKQFPVRYPVLEVLREETQLLVAVGSVYVALACGLCVRIRAARYLLVVGDVVAWAALAVLFSRGAGPTPGWRLPSFMEWLARYASSLPATLLVVLGLLASQSFVMLWPLIRREARLALDGSRGWTSLAPIWFAESPIAHSSKRVIALVLLVLMVVAELPTSCFLGLLTES